MSEHQSADTMHVAVGRPWKDAIVSVLDPGSTLRPWSASGDVTPGDSIVATVETDPVSVFAAVGVVGPDRDLHTALAGNWKLCFSGLLELNTVTMMTGGALSSRGLSRYHRRGSGAVRDVLDGAAGPTADTLFGHTSLAAARVLLKSEGRCSACHDPLNLTGDTARNRFEIHTAGHDTTDFPADWPAVLCTSCHARMRRQGQTSFLDFIFSLHPRCPRCGAQQAMSAMYGMPAGPVEEPWIAALGCVITEPRAEWCCGQCGHRW